MSKLSMRVALILISSGGVAVVGAIGIVLILVLNSSVSNYQKLVEHDMSSALESERIALAFKRQVQEWKNVLLRGHNPNDLEKYWSRFLILQDEIQEGVKSLLVDPYLAGEARDALERFQSSHADLLVKYQSGYEVYVSSGFDSKLADAAVRGIDRQPTQALESGVTTLERLAQTKGRDLYSQSFRVTWLGPIVFLAALIVVTCVALWFIQYRFTRPIEKLISAIDHLADGEFYNKVVTRRTDEVGRVIHAVSDLQDKLARSTEVLSDSVNTLSNADSELSQVTESISNATRDQSLRTDLVSAAVEEMTGSSSEVASNAAGAAHASKEADEAAALAAGDMESALVTLSSMSEQINHTTDLISGLEERATQVGTVLDVIGSVAEQTNLLALNAAIEAARAGDQGRGFAVVADEVRTLAMRTQNSTSEINDIISAVQEGASSAREAIDKVKEFSDERLEQAKVTSERMNAIRSSVSKILEVNQQIDQTAGEQSLAAKDINSNISEIAQHSQHTSQQIDVVVNAVAGVVDTRRHIEQIIQEIRKDPV